VELAKQFSRRGLEVVLGAAGAALTRWQIWEAKGLTGIDLREAPSDQTGPWLSGLDLRVGADVVHLVGCPQFASVPWRAPVVTTVCTHPGTETEWQELAEAVRRSHRFVSPTEVLANEVETRCSNVPVGRVIRHTRDGSQFQAAFKEPFILSTSRSSDDAEDLASLQWVAPYLRWPVVAAGTGTLGESCNGLCTLGLLPAPELSEWYGRASVFVLPARRKAFSLSALEAALSECALVLADLPCLREVWGDSAVYVPPGDRLALGAALTDLIDRPSWRHELSDRAKERSRSFRLQEMTDGYLAAYHEATNSGRAQEPGLASAG
jgi:glycosyltransferase involved in cell wall biosynthesis